MTVTMSNNRIGPCPHCHGDGRILDGVYRAIGDVTEFLRGPELSHAALLKLQEFLLKAKAANSTATQVAGALQQVPELTPLAASFSKLTASEWIAFLQLLVTIVQALLAWYQASPSSTAPAPSAQVLQQQAVRVVCTPQVNVQVNPPPQKVKKQSRNASCECGSQKKYKKCCGLPTNSAAHERLRDSK